MSTPSHSVHAEEPSTSVEGEIIRALADLVEASSADEPAAVATAGKLDALYCAAKEPAAVEAFLWSLWSQLISTARNIPADDPRQQRLVLMMEKLQQVRDDKVELWGQTTRIWTELPMLGPCTREAWDARPKFRDSEEDEAAVQQWVSLNSFAARVLGAKLQLWVNFAIWELRAVLEETPPSSARERDSGLLAACQWIAYAGEWLHEQGHRGQELDKMEERALKPGSLLRDEKSGLYDERWRFWRERLGLLGATAGSGALKERVQGLVEKMKEMEERFQG